MPPQVNIPKQRNPKKPTKTKHPTSPHNLPPPPKLINTIPKNHPPQIIRSNKVPLTTPNIPQYSQKHTTSHEPNPHSSSNLTQTKAHPTFSPDLSFISFLLAGSFVIVYTHIPDNPAKPSWTSRQTWASYNRIIAIFGFLCARCPRTPHMQS